MTEVQTRLESGRTSGTTEKESLLVQLDTLLEQYLNTLDQYQKAQQQLTGLLSSGYISLAQANFNNSSGTRYGQDYYDERMQASRKITLAVGETSVGFSVSAPDLVVPSATQEADAQEDLSEKLPADVSATTTASDTPYASTPPSITCTTPLRWFGILVPPALKAAQARFASAVEDPIPRLASLVKDLRKQEIDVARLRKQIKKLELKTSDFPT